MAHIPIIGIAAHVDKHFLRAMIGTCGSSVQSMLRKKAPAGRRTKNSRGSR
jgi:hypothetical protein